MSDSLLERLRAHPALDDCRDGIPEIDSWPMPRQTAQELLLEYYRITGRGSLAWHGTDQSDVDRVVELCLETGAKLTVHCSPQVFPQNGVTIFGAVKAFRVHWFDFMRMIARRVPVDKVLIDSEKMSFKRPARTMEDRRHNKNLAEFNAELYRWTQHNTRGARIGWYGHLASRHWAIENGLDGTKFEAYTNSDTPDDLGGGWSAYNPADLSATVRDLRRQVDNASLFQCTTGTIYLPLGHSQTWDQVPGIETVPHLTGKQYVYPYDCKNSHLLGRMVVDGDWHDQRSHGLSQRGGRNILAERVHSVCFWRGMFDPNLKATQGPQFIAFVNGLRGERFDESLNDWQAELWNQRG